MNDVEGGAVVVGERVRVVQTRERVDDDEVLALARERVLKAQALGRQLLRLLHGAVLDAVERLAVQILHRDEVLILDGPDLVRLHDVRMIETRRDARLVDQHLDELRLLGEVRAQPLDHRELAEARAGRTGHDREEDVGHPAVPELGDQSIFSERRLAHPGRPPVSRGVLLTVLSTVTHAEFSPGIRGRFSTRATRTSQYVGLG